MRLAALVLLTLVGSAACADRTTQIPEPPKQHAVTSFDIPVGVSLETDIVIVVDSSPAMADHATRAVLQLGLMFHDLSLRGDPDWHLAVISSDLGGAGCTERGDDGLLRSDGLVGSPFLIHWRHLDQRMTRNYEGPFAEAFVRLASIGTSGCATQQPLAAVRRALEDPRNAGFHREGAQLVVVVVSASDDRSPEPVADHVAFLDGLAPDRVTIAGVYDRPAARLDQVVAAFPGRSLVSALRAEDVTEKLHLWISGGGHWGVPCLEGELGPVPECSISDVLVEDERPVYETLIPACDPTSSVKPCWRIVPDRQNCPVWNGSEGLVLKIDRRDYPPMGTHVRGGCVSRSGQNP